VTFSRTAPFTLHPRAQPALRAWHAWLLAALLLAALALGLAHRIEHAPGLRAAWALEPVGAAAAASADPAPVDDMAQALPVMGSHHAGDPECRLVDQLGHADALCGGAWEAPALAPVPRAVPVGPHRVATLPPAAAYQARAPPQA